MAGWQRKAAKAAVAPYTQKVPGALRLPRLLCSVDSGRDFKEDLNLPVDSW